MDPNQSLKMRKLWRNPEYRKRQSLAHQEQQRRMTHAQKVAVSAKQSRSMKAVWAALTDTEHVSWVTKTTSPKAKRAQSRASKRLWQNPKKRALLLRKRKAGLNRPEVRAATSQRTKKLWRSPEFRAKVMATRQRTMYNNPVWLKCQRRQLAELHRNGAWNKGLTKETDSRVARISNKLVGRIPDYQKYRCWYRGHRGKTLMRSSYEVSFAQWLDREGLAWQYEPKFFRLKSGGSYTPDFYLPRRDLYIEVKGYLSPANDAKLQTFRREYPHIELFVFGANELRNLAVLPKAA